MKRITRKQLRGKTLDPLCKKAHTTTCPQATPPKTNGDRIRSMTDEELARILAEGCHGTIECPNCCGEYTGTIKSCTECWLEWLKEEVKE